MSSTNIKTIRARQLIDCKCRPMVEVDVVTEDGSLGSGSAPTGSSVGMYEAFIVRDNNPALYRGLSVYQAIEHVEKIIAPSLIGLDVTDQRKIDEAMLALDGTTNKSKLGGNAIYSTSIACLRAAASSLGTTVYNHLAGGPVKSVPVPSFNMVNGGKNGEYVLAFNEFLLVPYRMSDIEEAVRKSLEVFEALEKTFKSYFKQSPTIGHSYGWVLPTEDPGLVLSLMADTVEALGYTGQFAYALDCASSEMYDTGTGTYYLKGRRITSEELIDYARQLTEKFPLLFIEDLLDENDWDGYIKACSSIPRTNIIGDDIIATNPAMIKKAYDLQAIHGFILKPNQIGSITEALEAYEYARVKKLIAIPSGRAGGVTNDIIMDLAVGLGLTQIKNGAPRSGERIDKLNFLLRAASLSPGCVLSDNSCYAKF